MRNSTKFALCLLAGMASSIPTLGVMGMFFGGVTVHDLKSVESSLILAVLSLTATITFFMLAGMYAEAMNHRD